MTERIQSLHVTLDRIYREDDVQSIVQAIQMVRGVVDVHLGEPVNSDAYMAHQRVFSDFSLMMHDLLWQASKNGPVYQQIKSLLAGERERRT